MNVDAQLDPTAEAIIAGLRRRAGAAEYARLRRAVTEAGLLERRPIRYLPRALVAFAIMAAGIALPFLLPGTLGAGLGALVIGFALVQVGQVGHDAGHLEVFPDIKTNWALGIFCWSFTMGVGFWSWRDRHNTHHANTNDIEVDPDVFNAGIVAWTPDMARAWRGWQRWVTRHQAPLFPFFMLFVGYIFRILGWHFALTKLRGARRWLELALISANAGLWVAAIVFFGWKWLWIFIASQFVGGFYQGLVIAPNHEAMPLWPRGADLSYLERQVLSSRNINPGPITDYIFGGLDHQIEHHLFPGMPCVNLPRARALVMQTCAECELPHLTMSAGAAYRSILQTLARVSRYAGEPAPEELTPTGAAPAE